MIYTLAEEYCRRKLRFAGARTVVKYRRALDNLKSFLGRDPEIADLQAEVVLDFLAWFSPGRSPHTVNEARAKLVALWNYAARQGLTDVWPDVGKVPTPVRLPVAWRVDQFRALLDACGKMPGSVAGIPAPDWWRGLLLLGWATGERRTALLGFRWADWDPVTHRLIARAESRKGRDRDRLYQVPGWCARMLVELPRTGPLILPWDRSEALYFHHWNRLLRFAGLPADRWHKTHALRRSHASHLAAAGVDASRALGHSSPLVTYEHYLDPQIVGAIDHGDRLPDPTRTT